MVCHQWGGVSAGEVDRTVLHRWSMESTEGKIGFPPEFLHAELMTLITEPVRNQNNWCPRLAGKTATWPFYGCPLERVPGWSYTGQTKVCLTFTVSGVHGRSWKWFVCLSSRCGDAWEIHDCDASQNRKACNAGGVIWPSGWRLMYPERGHEGCQGGMVQWEPAW